MRGNWLNNIKEFFLAPHLEFKNSWSTEEIEELYKDGSEILIKARQLRQEGSDEHLEKLPPSINPEKDEKDLKRWLAIIRKIIFTLNWTEKLLMVLTRGVIVLFGILLFKDHPVVADRLFFFFSDGNIIIWIAASLFWLLCAFWIGFWLTHYFWGEARGNYVKNRIKNLKREYDQYYELIEQEMEHFIETSQQSFKGYSDQAFRDLEKD